HERLELAPVPGVVHRGEAERTAQAVGDSAAHVGCRRRHDDGPGRYDLRHGQDHRASGIPRLSRYESANVGGVFRGTGSCPAAHGGKKSTATKESGWPPSGQGGEAARLAQGEALALLAQHDAVLADLLDLRAALDRVTL